MVLDSTYFWLFLSVIGACNALALSIYFFLKKGSNLTHRLLSVFIFMIFIRISKSVCFFFYPEASKTYLQLGLTANFLVGPILLLYIKQSFKQKSARNLNWKAHLLPPSGFAILVGVVWPYEHYSALWNIHISTAIVYCWFAYLFASLISIYPIIINKDIELFKSRYTQFPIVVLCTSIGLWLADVFTSYTSYTIGILCFLLPLYLSLTLLISKLNRAKPQKYASKKISQVKATPILNALEKLMTEDELYKCPNLSLSQVADKLHISVPHLSQILNDNLGISFTSYINHHRIQLAKNLLIEHKKMSLKQISALCGYNNQSTFYLAFKKFTSTTPAKYRKEKVAQAENA
ncbi:helix-turn-helix domain-containing protein [Pseudoalteromonas luteoviolacea]|uniref:AraC family transcriptional regulator n=1 Tax=Pseudoalteromonas luteoviolacea TaxID=43657 RepID=UPI001F2CC19F|nr:helix-turn-helix domain-containing protein [Pseudoalteromonas luteoviolacea]MCF6440507.1 helix-turn-helix domain-containing protein [Pseudoalteromonas luteoviolacea]